MSLSMQRKRKLRRDVLVEVSIVLDSMTNTAEPEYPLTPDEYTYWQECFIRLARRSWREAANLNAAPLSEPL